MYRTYKRRFWLALTALLLFGFCGKAAAAPGMCAVTGTVYNIDGTVAANGSVMIRAIQTQTFGADTVQVTPEYITLNGSGALPAGVQVPLNSRIFIQVGRDKPVSVVAPSSGGSCPITFGALYGSALSNPPPPTTIVTSIGATNNAAGLVLSTTNPAGAGAANIALAASGVQTWTPTITGSGGNPTVTYSVQQGKYFQYGNIFQWMFFVGWTAFSGGTGTMQVSGFPLTQQNTSNFFAGALAWNWSGITLSASYTQIACQLGPNTNIFNIGKNGSGVTANTVTYGTDTIAASGQILCEGWGSQ